MTDNDSAIALTRTPLSDAAVAAPGAPPRALPAGFWWGLLGVAAFSLTVPFTRVAVGGLSPLFIGAGRAVFAAVLAAVALTWTHQRFPRPDQWWRLGIAGAGVVAGFPLLTSFALREVPAAHAAVVIAVLPAATAVATVVRTGHRQSMRFWAAATAGAIAVAATATASAGGLGGLHLSDLWLVGAVVAAAIGYAEGGLLARELGAWQTISWALVLWAPVMAAVTAVAWSQQRPDATTAQWAAFGYLGAVSMFLGFVAWYRGLALGPMAQVSQVQLSQPVMTLGWAALLLHETLAPATLVGAAVILVCTAGAVRSRR